MPTRAGDETMSTLSPDDAFTVLGNETRIAILQALWEAYNPTAEDNTVSFSDLYDSVDIRNTGNFSYHLDKLVGRFVEQTETGYTLTPAGFDVVQAVIAGTMTEDPRFGPTQIQASCPLCDAPVEVAYADNTLTCSCTTCAGIWTTDDGDQYLLRFALRPAGVEERTAEEAFRATLRYTFHKIAAKRIGVCLECSGNVESVLDICRNHDTVKETRCPNCGRPHMAEVTDICRTCKASARGPVRMAIFAHPTVTAFYHDHGIDHRFASWDAFRRSHNVREELASEDPLELQLSIPAGDEELHLTVDEDLELVDVSRTEVVEG